MLINFNFNKNLEKNGKTAESSKCKLPQRKYSLRKRRNPPRDRGSSRSEKENKHTEELESATVTNFDADADADSETASSQKDLR